ncbi:hypothetical protein I0C86_17810 [Plantactinospora sp. S1510]|uniref:Secreted protein n=1 Tax=Plantactinospora alkalitolerans TaxID=2789879 RepID=A0ABS0GXJ4_9ACTN|nr:hypothetical protein [Plantactinospora alkalitolerans]MBF9130801.1 hypothetical protein [Plantactinospora alkalitolerans]
MRFVTALVLMALLLGGGAARTGLPGTPGAAESRPDAVAAAGTSSTVDVSIVEVEAPTGDPTAVAAEVPTDDAGDLTADAGVPARLDARAAGDAGVSAVRPGTGAGSRPAGDAYPRVIGSRAPPLG